jgi:hypothetical protein
VLRATRTFVLVRDDGRYNVVLGDEGGRLVDVHAFDDTTTELGPDGIERHGPDGLPYEAKRADSPARNESDAAPSGV